MCIKEDREQKKQIENSIYFGKLNHGFGLIWKFIYYLCSLKIVLHIGISNERGNGPLHESI